MPTASDCDPRQRVLQRERGFCRPGRAAGSGGSVDHRYYDPVTGQFLNVDPLVSKTGAPYFYAGDDPVNAGDPIGLYPGEGLVHKALDVVAVPVYALYYGSYKVGQSLNKVGCSLGAVGCAVSHVVVAVSPTPVFGLPLPALELLGLSGDAALDLIKNQTTGNSESAFDEDVSGGLLPRFIDGGGPKVWLPGLSQNPCSGAIHIDLAW